MTLMNTKMQKLVTAVGGECYTGWLGSPNTVKFTEEQLVHFVNSILEEASSKVRNTDLSDVEGGDSAVLWAASQQLETLF